MGCGVWLRACEAGHDDVLRRGQPVEEGGSLGRWVAARVVWVCEGWDANVAASQATATGDAGGE